MNNDKDTDLFVFLLNDTANLLYLILIIKYGSDFL